jgi:O-acetyl-ADP-ribose deacetylase (regulator of RNase III)
MQRLKRGKMKSINYIRGDATKPIGEGNKIIAHVCNNIGGWGSGFVVALSNQWEKPENSYRKWFASKSDFELGMVQVVKVEDQIYVANMIAQHSTIAKGKGIPIRYKAVEQCLEKVANYALENNCSVHMPRIGCGLARGKWENIEPIIGRTLLIKDIDVFVYDL